MSKTRLLIFFSSVLLGTLWSCKQEPNLENIDGVEAFINVKFINKDSIDNLDSLKSIIVEELKPVDSLISVFNDSIRRGNADYRDSLDLKQEMKTLLDSLNTLYASTITLINSGMLKVDMIEAVDGLGSFTYEDSLALYKLPLPSQRDFAKFEVTIAGIIRSFEIEFEQDLVNENNIIKMSANIPTTNTIALEGFRDPLIVCADTTFCLTNEATISLSF